MESFDSIGNKSFLTLFRDEGYPTSYSNRLTFPNIDYFLTKILIVYFCLWLIFLIISPGYPGRERWFYICRITVFLTVPLIIIVCYHSPYWESDSINTLVRLRFSSPMKIVAEVGLHIGLFGFNITLKDLDVSKSTADKPKLSEEIGHLKYQYRLSASNGLPIPFLWVLDYFTIDGEEFRFTHFYQQASCRFSLGCWLLSSCLFCIVIEYGSLMMMLTGLSLITTNMIWALHNNPVPLEIPFQSPSGGRVQFLHPDFSWAYWINLTNGLFCLLLGSFVYIIDIKYPDLTAQFFGIDIIQNYQDYFREIDEDKKRLQSDGSSISTDSTLKMKNGDSNYVALRKKVTSDRLSRLNRLTLRDGGNKSIDRPVAVDNQSKSIQKITEPHYVVPKTITVPIQPRVVGVIPDGSRGVEKFSLSTQ
ncbi:dual oxidase maturation factor 1-like isoform X3 [Panonychus citri]|uniref:dual oxidase maturation factor 1-like isoform X3 n=1 Tax=Panonychus citri TaxID=50023 RepID=UPI002306F873|nr:dual oxidase maturation factor 1-like isoform X3 [Panonychus citri]